MGNIWTGLGSGIAGAGDVISKMFLIRHQNERENDAIQRALAQEHRNNIYRADQLDAEERRVQAIEDRTMLDDSRLAYEQDFKTALNFPNAPIAPEKAAEMRTDNRAGMVEDIPGLSYKPMTAEGAYGASETGPSPGARYRMPETERQRIEAGKNANRLQVQTIRNSILGQRMALDKDLAALKASLTREQIASIERRADDVINYNYDALDQRTAMHNAELAANIMEQEIRAEAQRNRQNPLFMIPGISAVPGQGAPSTPAPAPRTPPVVAPPTRGGRAPDGGAAVPPPAPAQGAPGGIAEALRRKQEELARRR